MRVNNYYDDVLHRYSRTAEALRTNRASRFDDVLLETAQRYAASQQVPAQRDTLLAFAAPRSSSLSATTYDPVIHHGEA